MSNINRDYLIVLDAKTSKVTAPELNFYIYDKYTANIFVNLVIKQTTGPLIGKYTNIENAEDYKLIMHIVKPSNNIDEVEAELLSKEDAIYQFDLQPELLNEIGKYKCELLTICTINGREEIVQSAKFSYRVKKSIYNDLDAVQETVEFPIIINLLNKLQDIEQYEEDRRANEIARQLAEEQRQARFDILDADMTDRIETIDDKLVEIENVILSKEDIANIKAKNEEQDRRLDVAENRLDNINTNIENVLQPTVQRVDAIEAINATQNDRLDTIEAKNTQQDSRLDITENRLANIGNDITNTMQPIIDEHTSRLDAIEAIDVAQNNRLDAIEAKNQQQDDRLLDIEEVNKKQDIDIKCLYDFHNNIIDITEEGNTIYLQNSTQGICEIDNIQGNTLVNCNKEPNKELILNGNINTSGDNTVTITEGVDGGLVDVALEGNTLVNVSKTKDSTAITKAYTVENSGNHVALQGDVDDNCRPVVTGNTLWIDNATEEVLTAFDETKTLRLQSSFEDNLVTQEMIDNGEEVADNLGKYKTEYKVTGKNKFDIDDEFIATSTAGKDYVTVNGSITTFTPPSELSIRKYFKIKVNPNTTYTISGTISYGMVIIYKHTIDTDMFPWDSPNMHAYKNYTTYENNTLNLQFTTGSDEHEVYMRFSNEGADTTTIFANIQIEEGNTATSYEPYKGYTKTLYLNSPLLEEDTIEEKDNGIYHIHRSELVAYTEGDETSLITDKVNTLHQLETPTYELIERSNLAIPSYTNGHLDFSTAVPVEKVEFKPFSEELTYLYANTQYTLQFISYKAITANITLGGAQLLAQSIVKGLNRINITTPETLVDNKLIIDGVGANIMEVIVTDIDRELIYFEGMKSVGECEELQVISTNSDTSLLNTQQLTHEPLRAVGAVKDRYALLDGKWYIERKCGARAYQEGDRDNYKTDLVNTVYPLERPVYEPIDYNPLQVYSGVTHITTNSTIPTNITVKNHGFNCLLKPNTTYTISSNLGLNTVTTGADIGDSCLRLYDTDTSDVTTMRDVLVLEGDWTSKADLVPANFSGMESAFEQEYDAGKGKYKVNIKVANENKTEENNITFYINEPLRGIRNVKDKVYVKDDKVVVERNCGVRTYEDGDFGTYITDKVNTVYPLQTPTYEEVEYNDTKLSTGLFKNSTLFYNSNVPVTSRVYYSYSVPLVDTVAQTASISDEQDNLIIDLATQVAVLEMMTL